MTIEKISKNIVNEIIDDMSDRGGLGDVWGYIDEDIQEEIKDRWKEIIKTYIS